MCEKGWVLPGDLIPLNYYVEHENQARDFVDTPDHAGSQFLIPLIWPDKRSQLLKSDSLMDQTIMM